MSPATHTETHWAEHLRPEDLDTVRAALERMVVALVDVLDEIDRGAQIPDEPVTIPDLLITRIHDLGKRVEDAGQHTRVQAQKVRSRAALLALRAARAQEALR